MSELPESRSSSASLSSPPGSVQLGSMSPSRSPSPLIQLNDSTHTITVNPAGVDPPSMTSSPAPGGVQSQYKKDGTLRKKPGRKPQPVDPNAPPKPARRPRKPRDPNAPPNKRRPKQSLDTAGAMNPNVLGVAGPQHPSGQVQIHGATQNQPQPPLPQSFFSNPSPQSTVPASPAPALYRSASSGQNYDPIRSNYDPVRETVVVHNQFPTPNPQGSPHHPQPHPTNHASASPSISSLVDPPNQPLASPSIATQSFFNQQQQQLLRTQQEQQNSLPSSPKTHRLPPTAMSETLVLPSQQTPNMPRPGPLLEGMNIQSHTPPPYAEQKKKDVERKNSSGPTMLKKSTANGSTTTSSTAASPKPPKLKEAKETYPTPPPLPGSGMMQFGGGVNTGTEFRAPTIVLNIQLNGETNKYINFTRLAEEQYGWDALHPRLAASRDRLARVAAAGAALERAADKESGDDMSLESEAEGSNAEMGGMSDGRNGTGTDAGKPRTVKKRKMKEDEYDKMDGFVDDSELLWEEKAAASNDGFFVYSGPLIPAGETPSLERGENFPKRARGRGRGGAARGTGTTRGGAAAALNREGLPRTGPGSRGGNTNRKPRMTKADRARMDAEKVERAKLGGMSSLPIGFQAPMTVPSSSNLGSTPLVFN
ncbi:hypothetical protein BJ878DRAFT_498141 [Calycina marina]|uniref:Hpc2-related domain-containing protein n=1 Tax=Calycina marina TaxID=1763456 RepID=A0A9P7Z6C7_9HELO|nr:hypothetical protein BJ878DRAFT_498141 [Calycina marina]